MSYFENKTFLELAEIYQESINSLEKLNTKIDECLDAGDNSKAKMFECGMNQYIDTLFEIEEILNLREEF